MTTWYGSANDGQWNDKYVTVAEQNTSADGASARTYIYTVVHSPPITFISLSKCRYAENRLISKSDVLT